MMCILFSNVSVCVVKFLILEVEGGFWFRFVLDFDFLFSLFDF